MPHISVAYQGIPGSFSHLATLAFFNQAYFIKERSGNELAGLGQSRFRDIFTSLASEQADFAVVPIENSLVGSIYEIYDLLSEFKVSVVGEHCEHIVHNLLCKKSENQSKEIRLKNIKKVFSHPKALEQCQDFFEKNQQIEKVIFSDTAGAAKHIADSVDTSLAAIASMEAAKLYDLDILEEHLEDDPHNVTRFLVIANQTKNYPNVNKCSLIFTLPHVPQSLFKALEVVSVDGINVTKIESRPIQGKPFEYVFYIDFEFPVGQLEVAEKRVEEFRTRVKTLKVLGYYPSAAR